MSGIGLRPCCGESGRIIDHMGANGGCLQIIGRAGSEVDGVFRIAGQVNRIG